MSPKYLRISKKTSALAQAIQNNWFWKIDFTSATLWHHFPLSSPILPQQPKNIISFYPVPFEMNEGHFQQIVELLKIFIGAN